MRDFYAQNTNASLVIPIFAEKELKTMLMIPVSYARKSRQSLRQKQNIQVSFTAQKA
jgi:hypothetical protein